MEENLCRKDFAPEELLAGLKNLKNCVIPNLGHGLKTEKRFLKADILKRRKTNVTMSRKSNNLFPIHTQADDEPANYGV